MFRAVQLALVSYEYDKFDNLRSLALLRYTSSFLCCIGPLPLLIITEMFEAKVSSILITTSEDSTISQSQMSGSLVCYQCK
jgi:hypothetical protein